MNKFVNTHCNLCCFFSLSLSPHRYLDLLHSIFRSSEFRWVENFLLYVITLSVRSVSRCSIALHKHTSTIIIIISSPSAIEASVFNLAYGQRRMIDDSIGISRVLCVMFLFGLKKWGTRKSFNDLIYCNLHHTTHTIRRYSAINTLLADIITTLFHSSLSLSCFFSFNNFWCHETCKFCTFCVIVYYNTTLNLYIKYIPNESELAASRANENNEM